MPSQETYDRGVALAQLVLGDLYTAYLSESKKSMYKYLPNPPPLAAGLKTPLPAALTGDSRTINAEEMAERGEDALEIIAGQIDSSWALGARYVRGTVLVY
jgi:metaxin